MSSSEDAVPTPVVVTPPSGDPPTVSKQTVTPLDKPGEGKSDKPALAQHDSSVLDLAFAMDCTGSMGSYIAKAQSSIRNIVEEIVATEKSDIQLALVEYRDHPPQDLSYVTRVLDFTSSVSKMKKRLDACSASGGGDCPEAVADALHQVSKLSWRKAATKICVFIADAPPHGLDTHGDSFPNGCPEGLDPMQTTSTIAQNGITMYMVGCEPAICRYKDFFMTIAHMTGGQYVPLINASLLAKVIIGGAQEEITLERLMQDAQAEVETEVMARGGWDCYDDCEEEISAVVMSRVNAKGGLKVKQLQMNASSLPEASTRAKKWSKMTRMSDVRKEFTKDEPTSSDMEREASSFAKKSKKSSFLGSIFGARGSSGTIAGGSRSSSRSRSARSAVVTDCMDDEDVDMVECDGMVAAASSPATSAEYIVAEKDCIDQVQAKRMIQKMRSKQM